MNKAELLALAARVEAAAHILGVTFGSVPQAHIVIADGEHGSAQVTVHRQELHKIAAALRAMAEEAQQ